MSDGRGQRADVILGTTDLTDDTDVFPEHDCSATLCTLVRELDESNEFFFSGSGICELENFLFVLLVRFSP